MTESTEIATQTAAPPAKIKARAQADGSGVLPIMPRNIEEAVTYADGICKAGIVPDAFRLGGKTEGEPNLPLVIAGILKSLEIGLAPQTGLANMLPLRGRFTMWGDSVVALVQQRGVVADHVVEWIGPEFDHGATELGRWPVDYGCRVSYWRKGQERPYIGEYTVAKAKRANLWNNTSKKPWISDPERMLFNRARALALRDGFSDCIFGLEFREEAEDYAPPKRRDLMAIMDDSVAALPQPDEFDLAGAARDYIAGLAKIASLEALAEYQSSNDAVRLFAIARERDDDAHQNLILENAKRYEAINAAEADARKAEQGSLEPEQAEESGATE